MASIEKYYLKRGKTERENLRYLVRYRRPDGRITMKRGFTRMKDAKDFAESLEVSKKNHTFIDPQEARITVGELAPGWLRRKKAVLKPSSYRPLESAWDTHVKPVWGNKEVSSIRKSQVQTWVTDLTEGTTTSGRGAVGASIVIRCVEVLRGVLDDALNDRRLLSNPASNVQLPKKGNKHNVYLTHGQVEQLADVSGRAALVYTLAYCGIRWGEAAGLQVKHVDFKRRRLKVERNLVELTAGAYDVTTPKSGKARSVPFPAFLEPFLKAATKDKLPTAYVFTEPGGGGHIRRPHSRDGWFVKALAGVDGAPVITPHDLRHSAASFAVSAGANVKAVQRMLGHSSAAMTLDVYADLFDDDLDDVAAALDVAIAEARAG